MESCSKRTTILPYCVAKLEWEICHFDLMLKLEEPTMLKQQFCSPTDFGVVWTVRISPKTNLGEIVIDLGHNLKASSFKAKLTISTLDKGNYITLFSSPICVEEYARDKNRIPIKYELIKLSTVGIVEWKFVIEYFSPKKIPVDLFSLTSEDGETVNKFSFIVRK